LKICILAAGAAGMYCGSCLRDNALALALRRAGHDAMLVPLYSPLRTDTDDASIGRVFYGGVNAWLQYATRLFQHTPRFVDWIFDRRWLLNCLGRFAAQASPAKLGPFTLSVLRGDDGPQIKELQRLADFLREHVRPDVLSLPNLMFMGAARFLRQRLGVPIICELTGEDIFLEAMAEPFRTQAQQAIRQRVGDVDRFVATSHYYARRMSEYLDIEPSRIAVVYPGVARQCLRESRPNRAGPSRTIGYFARICPEKGVHKLIEAFGAARRLDGMADVELRVAGYLGAAHRAWFDGLHERARGDGLAERFRYIGEVDLAGKLAFLDGIDLMCVPTVYPEPKGMYVLESLARGTPVVLPAHGAFPELVEATGGGELVPPGDTQALAARLAELMGDQSRRLEMGRRGMQAIRDRFTDDHMATGMLEVYRACLPK
jgi:glycosyltransferase involved in cell wall biosynthesis